MARSSGLRKRRKEKERESNNMHTCSDCVDCLQARLDDLQAGLDTRNGVIDKICNLDDGEYYRAYLELKRNPYRFQFPDERARVNSLNLLRDRYLCRRDLRKVIQWASIKIVRLSDVAPEGEALNQLFGILCCAAERGRLERLRKEATMYKEVETVQIGPVPGKGPVNQASQQSSRALATAAKPATSRKDMMEQNDEALTKQPPTHQGVKAEEEQILHPVTRAPMTDDEYTHIATRSLYLHSVLPVYSEDDMLHLAQRHGEVEAFGVIADSGITEEDGCRLMFFTMTSCEAADAAVLGLKPMMIKDNALLVGRPPSAEAMRYIQRYTRDNSRAGENVAVSSSTIVTEEQSIPEVPPKGEDREDADDICEHIIQAGVHKKRTRDFSRWDLLRGLKCATEESLQFTATAEAKGRLDTKFHFHVLNARNLPMGAYILLRHDLLGESIGRATAQVRDTDERTASNEPEGVHAAGRDPISRRLKTLVRNFPDTETMMLEAEPKQNKSYA